MAIWFVFFIAYGAMSFVFCRWLALKRVAAESDRAQFTAGQRVFAMLGILVLAAAPMGLEVVMRLALGRVNYESIGFLGFAMGWILAFTPGAVISRRILQGAGINPDE